MTSKLYKVITQCRVCGARNLRRILDLGTQPPANSLRASLREHVPSVPLSISRCGNCTTIQLDQSIDPDYLFANYVWVTGTSETARHYAAIFTERAQERMAKAPGLVLEVASNDGTFLKSFQDKGHTVIGVDPAKNIAEQATRRGIPTRPEFFGSACAKTILARSGYVDCVLARNVLPHVESPDDVIQGMALCLSADGLAVIEFHHAQIILKELHYDSIYHEHLLYGSLRTFTYLLAKHGLQAFDLSYSPISGGSVVLYASKREKPKSDALQRAEANENDSGILTLKSWRAFAQSCQQHRRQLCGMIQDAYGHGKTIIGYGASARSSTLLNFCGIDARYLKCVADKNTIKHNRFTPGTDIPILSPSDALAVQPDIILLLAWNFKDEILHELRENYHFRGDIIVPLPGSPQVVSA